MQTMTLPRYDTFTINVPHLEAKRFRAIIKAFGFDFSVHALSPMERSIAEEKAGMVQTYNSLDDLVREIG